MTAFHDSNRTGDTTATTASGASNTSPAAVTTVRQFTDELRRHLPELSEADLQSSLDYYTELVADRMEAGMTEEAAVAALGSPARVARELLLDQPLATVVKTAVKKTARAKKQPRRVWETVLIVLGSPIWVSLLLALAAVLLSVYAVLWAIIAALWAVDASIAAVSVGGIVSGTVAAVGGNLPSALLYLGIVLLSAGLAVAGYVGCLKLTVLTVRLSAGLSTGVGRRVKSLLVRKESADVDA